MHECILKCGILIVCYYIKNKVGLEHGFFLFFSGKNVSENYYDVRW